MQVPYHFHLISLNEFYINFFYTTLITKYLTSSDNHKFHSKIAFSIQSDEKRFSHLVGVRYVLLSKSVTRAVNKKINLNKKPILRKKN